MRPAQQGLPFIIGWGDQNLSVILSIVGCRLFFEREHVSQQMIEVWSTFTDFDDSSSRI